MVHSEEDEAGFMELIDSLRLDSLGSIATNALQLLQTYNKQQQQGQAQAQAQVASTTAEAKKISIWQRCAVFVAIEQAPSGEPGSQLPLSRLLATAPEVSLVEFFSCCKLFVATLGLHVDLQERIIALERRFVVLSIMGDKFRLLMDRLFLVPAGDVAFSVRASGENDPGATATAQRVRDFGWLLFLLAKTTLLADPPELVDAFYLMICCVELVYSLSPVHARRQSRQLLMRQLAETNAGLSLVSHPRMTLEAICLAANGKLEDVHVHFTRLFVPFLQHLQQRVALVVDGAGSFPASDSASAIPQEYAFICGLLDTPAAQSANLDVVRNEYELMVSDGKTGGVDERLIAPATASQLARDAHLDPSTLELYGLTNVSTSAAEEGDHTEHGNITDANVSVGSAVHPRLSETPSERASPSLVVVKQEPRSFSEQKVPDSPQAFSLGKSARPVAGAASPIQRSQSEVKWLIARVPGAGVCAAPSSELLKFFRRCGDTVASDIADIVNAKISRVASLLNASLPPTVSLASRDAERDHQTRAELAGKLFYRVLLQLLQQESTRLGSNFDFSVLLKNTRFLCATLSACIEMVLFSFKIAVAPLTFPASLQICEPATAFDVSKVFETVIASLPDLPNSIAFHLRICEERVLEQLAWISDVENGIERNPLLLHLRRESTARALAEELSQQTSSAARSVANAPLSALASPLPQSGRPPAMLVSPALVIFFRKVLGLANARTSTICAHLRLTSMVRDCVWQTLCFALLRCPLELCTCRHLDVQLLCSIYSVCRLFKLDTTFKNIVDAYRRQPHATPLTYRAISTVNAYVSNTVEGRRVFELNPDFNPSSTADIIRFYNSCFVPALSDFLMGDIQQVAHKKAPPMAKVKTDPQVKRELVDDTSSDGCAPPSAGRIFVYRAPPDYSDVVRRAKTARVAHSHSVGSPHQHLHESVEAINQTINSPFALPRIRSEVVKKRLFGSSRVEAAPVTILDDDTHNGQENDATEPMQKRAKSE